MECSAVSGFFGYEHYGCDIFIKTIKLNFFQSTKRKILSHESNYILDVVGNSIISMREVNLTSIF